MFVKKDLRKIQEILTDDKDDREKLLLGRRAPEFGGTIHILCQKRNAPALQNLKVLSLYENNLTSVAGIGNLQHSPIVELNIGRNNLTELPDEVGRLGRTLEVLWAEDNRMERLAPGALTGLAPRLRRLRLSGNRLAGPAPAALGGLAALEDLALDNNQITELPSSIGDLTNLSTLILRQNLLNELPGSIGNLKCLKLLHVSSNQLKFLPDEISGLDSLVQLYANSNQIAKFPDEVLGLSNLKHLNLSVNKIAVVPDTALSSWGPLDFATGVMTGAAERVKVSLHGNPCLSIHTDGEVLVEEEADDDDINLDDVDEAAT